MVLLWTRSRAFLTALCASDRQLAGILDAILGARQDVSEVGDIFRFHKGEKTHFWLGGRRKRLLGARQTSM
jgi:hypothetical protein